jgi:hypothetical protein
MKTFAGRSHLTHTNRKAVRGIAICLGALSFAGIAGGCAGAPSIPVAGAYFPAWLACGLIGVVTSIVARMVLVAADLAAVLPLQLLVCLTIGAVCAGIAWTVWVGL